VICAPAGHGKTTAVVQWLETAARGPVAWLSLAPEDDDPVRFTGLLLAALERIAGDELRPALVALESGAPLATSVLELALTALAGARGVLVLDDYDLLQHDECRRLTETLLDGLPHAVSVVLIGRERPRLRLARRAAAGRVTELGPDDLRFHDDEAGALLHGTGGLGGTAADVHAINERLHGWAAGLALVAASGLSLVLEWLQTLLPGRVPSRLDWAANTAGAFAGIVLAIAFERFLAHRWQRWRATHHHRLPFDEGAGTGLVLLLAWLLAQAAPQVFVFGTGRLGDAAFVALGIEPAAVDAWRLPESVARLAEGVGVFLTVLAIGGLVRTIIRPGARWFAITVATIACAAAVRAAGAYWLPDPQAPFGWLSAAPQGGLLVSLPALLACGWLDRRQATAVGLVALVLATVLHNLTPASDYQRTMIAAADHREWANLTALITAIGFAWPYAAIAFLGARLSSRRDGRRL